MDSAAAREKIILAVDTAEETEVKRLLDLAKKAGATTVKLGLQAMTALGPRQCSEYAAAKELLWVADAKLDDIPNTVASTVETYRSFENPPTAITMHVSAGSEAMKAAQETAGETLKMLGVTVLTSINERESIEIFGAKPNVKVVGLAQKATESGLKGVVCSPREVGLLGNLPLWKMIPGTRSEGAQSHDQKRRTTPAEAIRNGADALVIGRQITQAEDPEAEFNRVVEELANAYEIKEED